MTRTKKEEKMAGKRLRKRGIALALSVILAGGGMSSLIPSYDVQAEETPYGTEAEAPSYEGRPAVHDYGKSGDDPDTPEDESEIVANSDLMKSAQYQESTKYRLKANGTEVSVYNYQKQENPGQYYHMDIARFSSDDAEPVFEIELIDGSTIDSIMAFPERYYPEDAFYVSEDRTKVTFQMSEGLRYCIVNINGTEDDTNGKPQLAIINDPTETDRPDVNAQNVLNFKEFSDSYLEENPITDTVGEVCTEAGTVTDTSLNNGVEYTWEYSEGKVVSYDTDDVTFPNKRARLPYDVSDAFQAALEEVRNSDTLDTIYFPAGTYVWSGLSIKNWDGNGEDGALNIYLDEDALLVNRRQECREAMEPAIGIWDSSNITVSGRGIIDGQGTWQKTSDQCHARLSAHQGGCMVVRSQNITFNDTYVRDVKQWNWECHTGENITYNNIKGLSPFQHSWVDGLDLTSGKNITVNGAITMGNDDTFASGHFNSSNQFPQDQLNSYDLSDPADADSVSQEDKNIAAAAAIYNADRLEWDQTDNENFEINNTLGWSTYANAVRLGHNTKWKSDGGSYQMRNYTFNNLNTVHVMGYGTNGGGGALSIQNGTSGCYPNYESIVFNNCSFTANAGNSANIPNGNDLTNWYPENITLSNCWFKDADTPLSFKKIKNVTIEDLYLGGKLIEYTSQVNLTLGEGDQAVDNFVFTANGESLTENELPSITYPDSDTINAYVGNPLIFYVKAEDPDGDSIVYSDTDVSGMEGAVYDPERGRFSWTPSEADQGNTYEVIFGVSDYTGQEVAKTVRIRVGSPENGEAEYQVSEDAHVQSWDSGERDRTYGERGYITMSLISGKGEMGEEYDGTGGSKDGKISYLKFDLSDISAMKDQFDRAELELTLIGPRRNNVLNTDDTIKVAVADDNWNADEVTWNTKPAFEKDNIIESEAFNLGENYGDANKNNATNPDLAINGTKVRVDITLFVNEAIEEGKSSLSLALCETQSKEIYFVSTEGAQGLLKNASADMAPKLLLNLPVDLEIEGPDSMTVYEGQAAESNSFALKGTGPFEVTLSGDTADGKITWDSETQQIKAAEGLAEGEYSLTLTVTNGTGAEASHEFVVTVEKDPAAAEAREALQKAYDDYKDTENDNYTEESWNAFTQALAEAEAVLEKDTASVEEMEAARDALITARGALTQKEPEEEPDPEQPLRITANPEDAEGAAGDNAVFTVAAEGTGLTYQWQYCNANSSVWRTSSLSGNDTPEITVPIAKYRDGQKYRCVVTDQDGNSVTSESASIKMIIPEDMPVITSQPEDFTGISGEKAVFEVKAEGTNLTYQWQYCNEGSNVWRNSSMEGSTTSAISVEIASYRDGQKYRCVVTGGAGHSVTSDAAAIIVGLGEGAPQITGQPENYAGAVGDTAVFEVKASGTNLTYQWQYCNADSSVWRASSMEGSTTASVSVPVTAGRDGQKYRCVITSGNGRTAITETAVMTVVSD